MRVISKYLLHDIGSFYFLFENLIENWIKRSLQRRQHTRMSTQRKKNHRKLHIWTHWHYQNTLSDITHFNAIKSNLTVFVHAHKHTHAHTYTFACIHWTVNSFLKSIWLIAYVNKRRNQKKGKKGCSIHFTISTYTQTMVIYEVFFFLFFLHTDPHTYITYITIRFMYTGKKKGDNNNPMLFVYLFAYGRKWKTWIA